MKSTKNPIRKSEKYMNRHHTEEAAHKKKKHTERFNSTNLQENTNMKPSALLTHVSK